MKDVNDWVKDIGIYPVSQPDIDIDYIIKLSEKNVSEISDEELFELISRISAYSIYLKSQKGSISSQIIIKENTYRKKIHNQITRLLSDDKYKYYKREDKENIILNTNKELRNIQEEIIILKSKLERIRDLPYSIDNCVGNLKMIYSKRIRQKKEQGE